MTGCLTWLDQVIPTWLVISFEKTLAKKEETKSVVFKFHLIEFLFSGVVVEVGV